MAALLSLSQARDVYACTCLPPPPVSVAVDEARAVFAGRIIDISTTADPTVDITAKFAVSRVWKGPTDQRVIDVRTPSSSAACGLSFSVGDEWLIYAGMDERAYTASLCSRAKPLSAAAEDLAVLGEGTVPLSQPPPTSPGPRGCSCDMAPEPAWSWGVLATLGAAGVLGLRRRRRLTPHG